MALTSTDLDSLKALPCFDLISDVSLLSNGLSHTCIKVTTPTQSFFVKKLNQETSKTEVFCTQAISSIELENRFSPRVFYYDDNWLVTEFIDGLTLADSRVSDNKRLKIGLTLMATLHQLSPVHGAELIPLLNTFKSVERLFASSTNSLASNRGFLDNVTSLLTEGINTQIILSEHSNRLCHGDLNYTNILIDKSQGAWLIDFECAHLAPVEFDIAMFIAVNNIATISIDLIITEYMALDPGYTINKTLLSHYILYSYFINGLWYYDNKIASGESEEFVLRAREQWAAFDKFAITLSINIPHLSTLLPKSI